MSGTRMGLGSEMSSMLQRTSNFRYAVEIERGSSSESMAMRGTGILWRSSSKMQLPEASESHCPCMKRKMSYFWKWRWWVSE